MTLTQLEYVLAVATHQHFGKAAKACFVTQPTLSMQIQKLEDELEVKLFDRSKSPILPTAEAHPILEQARVVIREERRLHEIVEAGRGKLTGEFRLSVIPTLSTYILPRFLQSFARAHPDLRLVIEECKTEEIIRQLRADEADAGLLVTPLDEPSITERKLFYEPFHLFVSSDHPLAAKKKVREDDLDIREIWLLNKGNCFRDQVLNICAQHGGRKREIEDAIRFESGNLETLKNMVMSSSGYTILPHLAVETLAPSQKKWIREFAPPVPTREISLVHARTTLRLLAIEALEAAIGDSVPAELRSLETRGMEVVKIH